MLIDNEAGTIEFRQSWLGTAQRCPEEGRLMMHHDTYATDETFIGSAAHHGIEKVIDGAPTSEIADHVLWWYDNDPENELPTMRFTKRKGIGEMRDLSVRCALAWVKGIMPVAPIEDMIPEAKFKVFLFEYRGFKVFIKGTMDGPTRTEIWDWKTSASKYEQKKKQMWAIQPTAYSVAAVHGGLNNLWDTDPTYRYPMYFNYGVMIKRANECQTQIVTVQRTQEHEDFMIKRMKDWIDLALDFGTDVSWPLIDEGNYLCSAKWCDFYDQCRGKFVSKQADLYGYNPQ